MYTYYRFIGVAHNEIIVR